MTLEIFARTFLASYFLIVAVFYTAKMMAVRARTGLLQQSYGRPGSAQFVGRVLFDLFRTAILGLAMLRAPLPQIDAWLGPIAALQLPAVTAAGIGLLLATLGLVIYAHSYLGADWRTGVPADGPCALVMSRPYARLRHPIFLGVHLGQIGLFLAWPTIFTVVCLAIGAIVIQVQARIEDRRLSQSSGAAYDSYCRRTSGFVPWRLGARSKPGVA
jgi:protein-S-isoprenylcysteine O-methyltransferase Ste14